MATKTKAQKHQEKRARATRRETAKHNARYAGAMFRQQVAERIWENNQPKPKVKDAPKPVPEEAA